MVETACKNRIDYKGYMNEKYMNGSKIEYQIREFCKHRKTEINLRSSSTKEQLTFEGNEITSNS